MEFPDLGKHCSKQHCNKLDFLPIKCDICSLIFCNEHFSYLSHNCQNAYLKNNQVPVCPLCNKPVPVSAGQEPDRIVGAHIDNDCQSDPAVNKRKVFTNRCTLKGCKVKEIVPVVCTECKQNFCLKHRHSQDHQCGGKNSSARTKALNAAVLRNKRNDTTSNAVSTPNSNEDDDLARALALSLQDSSGNNLTQEQMDQELARQLQASEYNAIRGRQGATEGNSQKNSNRCTVT